MTTSQKKNQKKTKFNVVIEDLVFEFDSPSTATSFAELAHNYIKNPKNVDIKIEIK